MEKQPEITIQCATTTARLEYVANFLSSVLRINVRIGVKQAPAGEFKNTGQTTGGCFIHYGIEPIDGAFNIFASGLLHETGIRQLEPDVIKTQEHTFLFAAPDGFDMPFDLFTAIFYLLSRYEEYLPYVPDRYGRFEANQSLAFMFDFLEEPVIDQWIELLKTSLTVKFPEMKIPEQEFRFVSTFDVDSPWATLHKGFMRTPASLLKCAVKLDFRELRLRLAVLCGRRTDPFDTYAYVRGIEDRFHFRSTFFFLSGNKGPYDVNYAINTRAFRNLLTRLRAEGDIGIHPSYTSNQSESILKFEFERFTGLLGRKPESSRQHYLLLKFPDTYRRLISLGIKTDYSMGYASQPGFRAGTSLPFRFYDLLEERETSLLIHPFAVMDVTLQKYLGLNISKAAERISRLMGKVKTVNGCFTSLWHNESLSEQGVWKGWREVFEGMVEEVKSEKVKVKR